MPKSKVNRVILCIIDDVRSDQFFSLIKKGLLPNCKKLMESGMYSTNCITDFPALTYPTQVSIITGAHTGDYRYEVCHGVPLSNWMDRNYNPPLVRNYGSKNLDIYKINEDLGDNCKTICEMIQEGNKTSIIQFINRGVDYYFPENKLKLALYYLMIKYYPKFRTTIKYVNTIVIKKLLDIFRRPNHYFETNEAPICSLLWFLTSDMVMHKFGSESLLYKINLMQIDRLMGLLISGLKELGYLDDTAIALTSDHGNYRAQGVGNLDLFYKHTRLSNYHPRKNQKGMMNISEFASLGFFYFNPKNMNLQNASKIKDDNPWFRPSLEFLEAFGTRKINVFNELFRIKSVKLLYYAAETNTPQKGQIFLQRKVNANKLIRGRLEYRGSGENMQTRYVFEDSTQQDVFKYYKNATAVKYLNGKFYGIDEWLKATSHLDFPLYPDLLCRHFKNPRSADIIVSTEGDITYNIEQGKKKSNQVFKHDIGARRSSIVPLIISGSNEIPKGEISYCKITDIIPTLLSLLGKKAQINLIGNNLKNNLI
ncbi:MAG: Type I phosphodiesterase / nucleotide pyrophosphatase [Promethearchaeota archaeon]|nr:MAG: Type I phosphodiesterase / nucleotide pyrophosphatase [Candidatus Lokiarchaeota archaeon]